MDKLPLADRLKKLDERITQEMATCHQSYDEDRKALAAHHGKMDSKRQGIQAEIEKLRPEIENFLTAEEPGEGLTKEVAQKCLRYLELVRQLGRVRTGSRLAYGATVQAGQQPLGQPLGTPPVQPDAAE